MYGRSRQRRSLRGWYEGGSGSIGILVSIPSSSGHYFQHPATMVVTQTAENIAFQSLLPQATTSNGQVEAVFGYGEIPWWFQSLLHQGTTSNLHVELEETERYDGSISIPSSSGHYFQQSWYMSSSVP